MAKDEIKKTEANNIEKVESQTSAQNNDTDFKYAQSFKAGYEKAKKEMENSKIMNELKELRNFKVEVDEKAKFNKLSEKIKALKDFKIKGSKFFIKEFHNQIDGKSGDDLINAIKKIKEKKENSLFFDETKSKQETLASKTLIDGITDNKNEEVEFYPGTSIRKN